MPRPAVEKMEVPVRPVQTIPSVDVAMLFVPCPTATQSPLLKATLNPILEKMVIPLPVHKIPSVLVAMV